MVVLATTVLVSAVSDAGDIRVVVGSRSRRWSGLPARR
jgi:hypothetical protein